MPKTYYLKPFWRVYAVGIFLLSLVLASAFVWLATQSFQAEPFSQALMFVFAVLLALLGAFLSVAALRVRLVVSPAGLLCYGIGYQVHADWNQVAGLDSEPGCSGLFVPNPTVTADAWLSALLRVSPFIFGLLLLLGRYRRAPDLIRSARCIPVRAFTVDWEESALARDIDRYLTPRQTNRAGDS
jgi:hypothetical protein